MPLSWWGLGGVNRRKTWASKTVLWHNIGVQQSTPSQSGFCNTTQDCPQKGDCFTCYMPSIYLWTLVSTVMWDMEKGWGVVWGDASMLKGSWETYTKDVPEVTTRPGCHSSHAWQSLDNLAVLSVWAQFFLWLNFPFTTLRKAIVLTRKSYVVGKPLLQRSWLWPVYSWAQSRAKGSFWRKQ